MRNRRLFCQLIVGICCIYGLYTVSRATMSAYIPSPMPPAHPLGNMPFNLKLPVTKTADPTVKRNIAHSADEQCEHRLPQCIMIGLANCGTTTLITFLNYHPQIAVNESLILEKNFFNMKYKRGLDWYRQQMACSYSNQVTMEKSPGYYICPECPKLIYEMDRDIKLLLIVKDPITRTVSGYVKKLEKSRTLHPGRHHSIEELMMDQKTGELMLEHPQFTHSNYSYHLRNWLAYFTMEQIHVVDGHAFESNPASELRRVEKYLGIEPFFQEDQFVFNRTKGKYCFKLDKKVACMPERKGTKHPELSPELLQKLKKLFHPMNREFYHMIGRRFDWGC